MLFIALATIFIVGGLISVLVGVILNIDPISLGISHLLGRGGSPGASWIILGFYVIALGIIILIAITRNNDGEKIMISGIISIITLGILFLIAGGTAIFIGIQLDNALRHAWDYFTSYWTFGASETYPGTIFFIAGIAASLIGIAFIVIGILEATSAARRPKD